MEVSLKLSIKDFLINDDEKQEMSNTPYKEATRSFTSVMINTHLDLAYLIRVSSQYMV